MSCVFANTRINRPIAATAAIVAGTCIAKRMDQHPVDGTVGGFM